MRQTPGRGKKLQAKTQQANDQQLVMYQSLFFGWVPHFWLPCLHFVVQPTCFICSHLTDASSDFPFLCRRRSTKHLDVCWRLCAEFLTEWHMGLSNKSVCAEVSCWRQVAASWPVFAWHSLEIRLVGGISCWRIRLFVTPLWPLSHLIWCENDRKPDPKATSTKCEPYCDLMSLTVCSLSSALVSCFCMLMFASIENKVQPRLMNCD